MPTKKRHHHRRQPLRGQWVSAVLITIAVLFCALILLLLFVPDSFAWWNNGRLSSTGMFRGGRDRHIALDYDGIDISHHQGVIDWERVARDPNIQFVYIKATEGSSHIDEMYDRNMRGARAVGLNVGAYHYLTSSSAVTSQFANFKSQVIAEQQTLIPMVDVEPEGVHGWTREQLQDSLLRFMKLIEKHYGRAPILYSYSKFYNENLAPEFNDDLLFIARYSSNSPVVNGAGRHHIWQHSDQGVVEGIPRPVDLDVFESGTTLSDILLRHR